MDKDCKNCGLRFSTKDGRKIFCSRSCSAQYNNSKRDPISEEQRKKISEGLRKHYADNPDKIVKGKKASERAGSSTKGKYKEDIDSILEASPRTVSKILKRLELGCSVCNWKEGSLDVHHIRGRKIEHANSHSNLTVLCPNCHRLAHEGKIDSSTLINLDNFLPANWKETYYG